MKILVLGGDGYLGWPTALHLSDGRPRRRPSPTTSSAGSTTTSSASRAWSRSSRCRPASRLWQELTGQTIAAVRRRPDRRRLHLRRSIRDFAPGRGGALRRAARRAVLHDRPQARGLHPDQQRGRHPQPAVRDRRDQPRHPPGQARHDGRVRHAEHRHRGGLAGRRAQGPHRPGALPEAAGLLLPPVQGARQPQHRVRLPDLGPAGHRPQPGRRLRPADRRDGPRPRGWPPGSTTTRCSARCSTGSSSRRCSAIR